jgi:Flp pilus assembly protein TadD
MSFHWNEAPVNIVTNPAVDPMVYYEEALRRDPDDLRVNTAVGILMLRKGLFEEAERHLRRAMRE